jgi:hypothetical protein
VTGDYSQRKVQEPTRILIGVGVNVGTATPTVRPERTSQYLRQGLLAFNPNRHDYGDKQFLDHAVKGRGLPELDDDTARLRKAQYTLSFVDAGAWPTAWVKAAPGLAGRPSGTTRSRAGRHRAGNGRNWRATVIVAFSEFGRSFRENGNRATDHGHGADYWVLSAIHGGKIFSTHKVRRMEKMGTTSLADRMRLTMQNEVPM